VAGWTVGDAGLRSNPEKEWSEPSRPGPQQRNRMRNDSVWVPVRAARCVPNPVRRKRRDVYAHQGVHGPEGLARR
jgi:hypothetical protein